MRDIKAKTDIQPHDKLDVVIKQMKSLAETLIPYSFPKRSADTEEDISILKTREEIIDGYEVSMYYGMADYATHQMETFQVYGQETPFLPFYLVCKLARRFLGDENLAMVDVYVNNKKLYIWTLSKDLNGNSRPSIDDLSFCEFEGFKFGKMNQSQVNFL